MLLDESQCGVLERNGQDNTGCTPLYLCVGTKDLKMLKLMLATDPGVDLEIPEFRYDRSIANRAVVDRVVVAAGGGEG